MKKLLTVIILILASYTGFSQVSNTKVVRIANSSTQFTDPLSEGSILIDLDTDNCYLILRGIAGTQSLSGLSEGTDYQELASSTITGNASLTTVTADTVKVNSLTYTNTYYDDIQINPYTVNLRSTDEAVFTSYKGAQVLNFPDDKDAMIYFTLQIPHQYKEGSNLSFHLHTVYSSSSTSSSDSWTFTYAWANVNDSFPTDETSVTSSTNVNLPVSSNKNSIRPIATLDGTGKKMSSILICSLMRNGIADAYNGNVYVLSMDFHMEMDKPGSDEPY